MQSGAVVAVVAALNLPGVQGRTLQLGMPLWSWYSAVSRTQSAQVAAEVAPLAVPRRPAGHRSHASTLVPPDCERNLPLEHGEHSSTDIRPLAALYVPAGHEMQLGAFTVSKWAPWPYWPAGHADGLHVAAPVDGW